MTHKFIPFVLLTFIATTATAQNVGVGTNSPNTKLDIAGAITLEESTLPATNTTASNVLVNNVSQIKITHSSETAAFTLTGPSSPVTGQILHIYNTTTYGATFPNANNTVIPAGVAMEFIYSNATWVATSPASSASGAYIQNQTSADQSGAGFRTVGNGYFNSAASQVAIGTATPASGYQLTLTPNSTTGGGISIAPSGASGNGINIAATSSGVNGINVTNSSTSTSANFFGVSGILSSTRIVSGYLGYRDGSGNSFGLYGVNGTIGTYATAANTWAGFLQGRTVISSESAPSSAVGTDLEVRNTTTGAAAPATVSLRQTTSETTSGTVLANVNFGDNYVTTPQAQIQVIRDATSSNASDLPTAIALSTTPDGSTTLTERMRVTNTGNVGIGSTAPATYLQLGNTNNLANSYLTFAVGNTSLGTNRTWQIGVPYGGSTTSSPNYGFAITDVNVSTSVTAASTPFMIDYITHNIGIGTITPSNLLSVGSSSQFQVTSGGAIAAATGITSSGAITFSGLSTLPGLVYANSSGVLSVATASNLPSGSGSYVQINPSSQQSGSFSISGTGVIGGNATVSGGTLTMNNGSSNTISFATSGLAGPSTSGTPSVGTRLLLYPSSNNPTGVNAADWAIGMNSGMIWYGVSQPIAGHAHVFYGGPNELMRIEGNGAVGIGTSSPGSNLLNVSTATATSGAGYGINLVGQAGSSGNAGGGVTISGGTGGSQSGGAYPQGGPVVITAGNSGSSGGAGIVGAPVTIAGGNSQYCAGCGLTTGGVNIYGGGNTSSNNAINGNINFYVGAYNGAGNTLSMTVDGANAYVGIGTSSPGNTLTVNGSGGMWNSNQFNFYQDGGSTQKGFIGEYTTNSDLSIASTTSGNWMRIGANNATIAFFPDNTITSTANAPKVFITSAGNTTTSQLTVGNTNGSTGTGTTFSNMQAGSYTLSTSSGGVYITGTISFPNAFPSGVTPNIICTMNSAPTSNYNDTYVVHVRSKNNTGFVCNIYRVDSAGGGWGQTPAINWFAWY